MMSRSYFTFPIISGQIIATSHDLGPQKVAFWKGNGTLISGKSRLVKYYSIWPDHMGNDVKKLTHVGSRAVETSMDYRSFLPFPQV